jgi:hypothetical protein
MRERAAKQMCVFFGIPGSDHRDGETAADTSADGRQ